MWNMSDEEFQNVLKQPAEVRYKYFINHVADWGILWSLWNKDGWVLAGDNTESEIVPLWPHQRFASACISGKWSDTTARSIKLSDFIERWIPGMLRDNRLTTVFPTPEMQGAVVSPQHLKADLEQELSCIE